MKSRAAGLLPLGLMLLLAALTIWLEQAVQAPAGTRPAAKRHDPDLIIDNFTSVRYGDSGVVAYSLQARKMVHYPVDDSSHLDQPRIASFTADGPPLRISAREGNLAANGEDAVFYGDVLVLREAGKAQPELRIATNRLLVNQKKDTAHTDDPVTITQGKSVLTGTGMDISRKERTFKLRTQARGTFVRQN